MIAGIPEGAMDPSGVSGNPLWPTRMQMKNLLTGLLLIAALSTAALATPRGASTAKERVKFVRVARNLELKPLAFGAVQQRQWATEFIVRIPDLHLEICD